jgi:hypothetical protein
MKTGALLHDLPYGAFAEGLESQYVAALGLMFHSML